MRTKNPLIAGFLLLTVVIFATISTHHKQRESTMTKFTASFTVRNLGRHSIIVGTFSHAPNDIISCENMRKSVCHLTGDQNNLILSFDKEATPLADSKKQATLSDMCMSDIWHGCSQFDPSSIAGRALFIETFLLDFESNSEIARKTFLTVLENHGHEITKYEHVVFEGVLSSDLENPLSLSFSMTRNCEIDEKELRGYSISDLLTRTPCKTHDGVEFFNHIDLEAFPRQTIKEVITEISKGNEISNELGDKLDACYLSHYYKDCDYIDFVKNISQREPGFIKKLTYLLTKRETEELKGGIKSFLQAQMGV
tara:strand:- start:3206 stop:4138 length:933 start_codon:yes stop_codon:yes gene_type:complete